MSSTKNYNKLSLIALCAAVSLSYGCADDDWRGSGLNSDRITYALVAESAQNQSRSGVIGQDVIPMLTENGTDTLFLHPTISDMPAPGAVQNNSSRGVPVENENFATVIKEFGVEAYTSGDNRAYIKYGKVDSHNGNNIWTQSTASHYWPEYDLDFYAVAPYSLQETNPVSFDLTNKTMSFTYSTPKSTDGLQDATVQPDIMLAYAGDVNQDTQNGQVPTQFWHALAGIRFKVSDVAGGTVKSIKLNNIHGAGSVVFDCATETYKWTTSDQATNSYTQTFDVEVQDVIPGKTTDASGNVLGNQDITNVNPVTTFMMIPQALNANAEIEVVINAIAPGETTPRDITLSAKINANGLKSWEAGKIYTYTISTESINWTYVFDIVPNTDTNNADTDLRSSYDAATQTLTNGYKVENIGYSVVSYRYRTNNPNVIEHLPWDAIVSGATNEIADVNPQTGKQDDYAIVPAEEWLPDLTKDNGLYGLGGTTPQEFNSSMERVRLITDCAGDHWLKAQTIIGAGPDQELGTEDDDSEIHDLSYYDVEGNPSVRNTANCYVVRAAGRYKIPLVYGNAIRNGSTYTRAFTYGSTATNWPHNDALKVLTNHSGSNVTGPWIKDHVSVINQATGCLIWNDAYRLIENVKKIDNDFISFEINHDYLQQGNAIIALRAANGAILWSWHIWVTNESLLSDAIPMDYIRDGDQSDGSHYYGLSPTTIGWCDPKKAWLTGRTGDIQFTQYEVDGTTKTDCTFDLIVKQLTHYQESSYGNNPYYQHGRKDPMPAFMDHANTIKHTYIDESLTDEFGNSYAPQIMESRQAVKQGVRTPHIYFAGGYAFPQGTLSGAGGDWNWGHGTNGSYEPYRNLWNNKALPALRTNYDTNTSQRNQTYKTIYDPSPVGFTVPPKDAFRILSKDKGATQGADQVNLVSPYVQGSYQYHIYTTVAGTKYSTIFEATGQRWSFDLLWGLNPGDLGWPQVVSLWSSDQALEKNGAAAIFSGTTMQREWAYATYITLADGDDKTCHVLYPGASGMARPIRPVRDVYDQF